MLIGNEALLLSRLVASESPPPTPDYATMADTVATAWENAVIGASGSVTPERKTIIERFIAAEMEAGNWNLTDDYWPLWGESAAQALMSLKQLRQATVVAGPTFVANRGYSFNGSTQYVNTGFIPNTHTTVMTGTNQRVAFYERVDLNSGGACIGAVGNGTSISLVLNSRSGNNMFPRINVNNNQGFALSPVTSMGYSASSMNGALYTDRKAYKNGIELTSIGTVLTPGATITIHALFIGATNNAGTPASFRASVLGFATAGASLTPAQEAAQYANVLAWGMAVGAVMSSDTDVQSWINQVEINGGTVSAARAQIVTNFVVAEKAAGTWALTDDYWPLWAENSVQALTSLKQRRGVAVVGAAGFTPDRGYAFNGTSQCLATGFIPGTHAIAMTGTNQRVAVYERTDFGSGHSIGGTNNFTNQNVLLLARGNNVMQAFLNSAGANVTLPIVTSIGFTAMSRAAGGTTVNGYRNGIAISSATVATPGTVLPTFALNIGSNNLAGVNQNFRAVSTGFACVGAPLSGAQETAQYNNVQTWATSIGAQV